MKQTKQALYIILLLAVVLPALSLLVPKPDQFSSTISTVSEFRASLVGSTFFAWLYIGAAILFFKGLGGFKAGLKRAFRSVCIGLIALGLTLVQIPLLVAIGQIDGSWRDKGGLSILYVLGSVLLYVGVRSFAHVLGDKSIFTKVLPILLASFLIGTLAGIATNPPSTIELIADVANTLLAIVCFILSLRIKQVIGPAYTNSTAWFALALCANAVSVAIPTFALMSGNQPDSWVIIPFAITAVLFIKAGYAFNKIREY